jgi:cell fate (sporulation/competence/biofilm development) regulator YmcA (YheA/YmcA/DUF963 family)
MQPTDFHTFLFQLYDYADYLADQISADSHENGNYLMAMLYIEAIMDSIGRLQIHQAAKDAGLDASASLKQAHARIDTLRERITLLMQQTDFSDSMRQAVNGLEQWNYRRQQGSE